MFDVVNYKDRAGHDEISEYLHELAANPSSKDARIKLNKINAEDA
ncbi:hypothetical protein FACS18949_18110 [Clostridia bacterium]|nr:hypothetical protein FACS18949_18110 [Clostridia bacterium]